MISNRELAALIWIAVVFFFAVRQPSVREAMLDVLQAFFQVRVVGVLLLFGGYIAIWVRLAEAGGLWEGILLKDTVLWFSFAGLPLLFQFTQVGKDDRFFVRTVRSIFASSVFLEFSLNVTNFTLLVELALLPVATLVALMPIFVRSDERYAAQRRFWDGLLGIAGVLFIVAAWRELYIQRLEVELSEVALSLALLIWLPIASLPFVYVVALYAEYELALIRMKFANRRQPLSLTSRAALILGLKWRVQEVHGISGLHARDIASASTLSEALAAVQRYRVDRRLGTSNWREPQGEGSAAPS